jgi:nucleoside-diphosphate-sugar epimerase
LDPRCGKPDLMADASHHLLVFGPGYSGLAIARSVFAAGIAVSCVSRDPARALPAGLALVPFDAAGAAIAGATHLVATAAPEADGDPVLRRWGAEIAAAPRLAWIGYLSTTGVYGDRGGGWVDEATPPAPGSPRAVARLAAEAAWRAVAAGRRLDIFRLAGIYGPGRSAFDELRAGRARRVLKPGHCFGRIHRDDIAAAVRAAMLQDRPAGARILNLADDEPAESAVVVAEAARLLGMPPPPAVEFDVAVATMSPMARSFWAENRKVSSRATRAMLGLEWRFPGYREGLAAILAEERAEGLA